MSCVASSAYYIGDMVPVLEGIGSLLAAWLTRLSHDSWWPGPQEHATCSRASKTWEKMPLAACQTHRPKRISSVGAHCRTGRRKSRRLLLTPTILPIYAGYGRVTDGAQTRALRSHSSSETVPGGPDVSAESANLQVFRESAVQNRPMRTGVYQPGCSTAAVNCSVQNPSPPCCSVRQQC